MNPRPRHQAWSQRRLSPPRPFGLHHQVPARGHTPTRSSPTANRPRTRSVSTTAPNCASSTTRPTTYTYSCTTHPPSRPRNWSIASTASQPATCARSTARTCADTCGASTCGHRRTSPHPAAEHPGGGQGIHRKPETSRLLRDGVPPGPDLTGRGSRLTDC